MNAVVVDAERTLSTVVDLLKANNLPFEDIQIDKNLIISYSDGHGKIIGSGGLEFYGPFALLRSVAVEESQRGKAFGKEIVVDLLNRARNKPVREVYLLTETAKSFFQNRGFEVVTRSNVPDAIKGSSEFKTVCPESAACLVYRF